MAFMEPDIYFGAYFVVETNHGETHIVPADVLDYAAQTNMGLADYVEGEIDNPDEPVERRTGWLARLSAPGYLDCTDWSVHETQKEAEEYLKEMYGSDDDDDETNDETNDSQE